MLNFILFVIVLAVLVPTAFLVLQLLFSLFEPARDRGAEDADSDNFAVVIPAHDEADVIEATLENLVAEMADKRQLIVVADNCSDDTATLCRAKGVTVLERNSDAERGKGFALEFGVRHLLQREQPPAIVVFVDADCVVRPGSIGILIGKCRDTDGPVQGLYLMRSRGAGGIRTKIAEFAWVIKNQARPLGLKRLGLPCQLTGTGMAFPLELLERVELGSAHIVEDMKLGIDCARLGSPPEFCPAAVVESYFPEAESSIESQRQRWEHGHLGMTFYGIRTLALPAIANRDWRALAMALDLAIPPLSFLVLLLSSMTLLAALAAWLFQTGSLTLWLLLIAILSLGVSLLSSWYRFGREVISLGELLRFPGYVAAKIPMYLRYWFKRQLDWVRTDRD